MTTTSETPGGRLTPPPDVPGQHSVGRSWGLTGLSALAGLCVAFSMPPWGWWPLAFVGIAMLDQVLAQTPTRRQRFRRVWLMAAVWLLVSMLWMFDFTPPGYLLASTVYSGFFAVSGALASQTPWRRLTLIGGFTLAELLRWSWPFGGVPLSTLAMSQADAPLNVIARVGGPLLLSLTVVLVGVTLSAALSREVRQLAVGAAAIGVLAVLGLVGPRGTAVGTFDVAVVQGGGPQNTRATAGEEPVVFQRHLEASQSIDREVDLVLWPENVVNPKANESDAVGLSRRFASDSLAQLAADLDAPVLPGWFERVSDTNTTNYTNVYLPDGSVGDRYDKVRLVPFGEITPFRSVLENIAGDALQPRDVRPGTEPAVIDTPVGTMGISISWEIFFANRARDAIGNGGEVLLNPTNGSSYWLTIVQSQQIASSRLRAIETGRWVLQAAPTGFSAIIDPSGNVLQRTAVSEQRVLYGTVERREGLTWANRVGNWPALLSALVLAGAGFGLGGRDRDRAQSHAGDIHRSAQTG
jgi:apolipoprotein N-acyltransferase